MLKKNLKNIAYISFFLLKTHSSSNWGFDDFFDDIQNMQKNVYDYFHGSTKEFTNNKKRTKTVTQEAPSARYNINMKETEKEFFIELKMDISQLNTSHISSIRHKEYAEIKIINNGANYTCYLSENQYYVKIESQEIKEDPEHKQYASSQQQIIRQGTVKNMIDINSLKIEVMNPDIVKITANYIAEKYQRNDISVTFLNKKTL